MQIWGSLSPPFPLYLLQHKENCCTQLPWVTTAGLPPRTAPLCVLCRFGLKTGEIPIVGKMISISRQ